MKKRSSPCRLSALALAGAGGVALAEARAQCAGGLRRGLSHDVLAHDHACAAPCRNVGRGCSRAWRANGDGVLDHARDARARQADRFARDANGDGELSRAGRSKPLARRARNSAGNAARAASHSRAS